MDKVEQVSGQSHKPEVLVMVEQRPKAMAQLEAQYQLHRYDQAEDKAAFIAEFGPRCVAVVTNGHCRISSEELAHLPQLQIVTCSSAGFEYIDTQALQSRAIPLTNSSPALCDDVADAAVLLALATQRKLVPAHHHVTSGAWGKEGMFPLTRSIKGQRVGIVGMGQIGQAIADRLTPMKAEIAYMARSPKSLPYQYEPDLMALATWADMLVVIVPGGPETQQMINAEVLTALGPRGTLINVARGTVVDEAALVSYLQQHPQASAGLDVYWNEPEPNAELVALPNVTLYPHHASGTVETRDAMAQTVVDNLAAHFAGLPLLTRVV